MAQTMLVAVVVGLGLGVFLQKGRFCFVNAFRDLFAYRDGRVTKGVVAATVLTMLCWSVAYHLGYYQGFWTPSWGLTGLIGGFVFGVGMTYAGGCATGTLYRAGQGYLHFWLTLLAMGAGYAVFTVLFPTLKTAYFAPLQFGEGATLFQNGVVPAPVLAVLVAGGVVVLYAVAVGREKLDAEGGERGPTRDRGTAAQLAVTGRTLVVGLRGLGDGTRSYLRGFLEIDDVRAALRRPWDPRTAALGITALAVLWFTQVSIVGITGPEARWTGYLLERVGVDAGSYEYWGSILFRGDGVGVTVDMVMIGMVIVGAFLAAWFSGDFSVRWPKRRRLPNAVFGGLLMGFGSRIAPGCNVGNIYSGLAELSIHSFVAAAGIVLGTYVMTHWLYRDVGCAI